MHKRLIAVMLCGALSVAAFSGCADDSSKNVEEPSESQTAAVSETEADVNQSESEEATDTAPSDEGTLDRSGNPITIPENVDTIVSLAPSTTQFLIEIGVADKIIGIDNNSEDYMEYLNADIPKFDMMNPDNEKIAALEPDIVFTSGMSSVGGESPFQPLIDSGICVADIPSSTSIDDIALDLEFIGECVGEEDAADKYIQEMYAQFDAIEAASANVGETKTVLYMMSIPSADYPTIYTFGAGTYQNEMLEKIGAENACKDMTGWVAISEEEAVAMNPDVILTDVYWMDDAVGTIEALEGWSDVTAVKNGDVYLIDANLASRPNEHVADAALEWGELIYPEVFAELADAA